MIGLEFDEWHEVECWIEDNICNEFIDDDVNMIYRLLFMFDDGLLGEMMNETSYKLALKYQGIIAPSFIDRQGILDNLKDILLVGGSQDYSLDDYMDWDGFVQAEIDSFYEEFEGLYLSLDELRMFRDNVRANCIL